MSSYHARQSSANSSSSLGATLRGVTDRFLPPEGGGVGLPLLEVLADRNVGDVGDTNLPLCCELARGGEIDVAEGRS